MRNVPYAREKIQDAVIGVAIDKATKAELGRLKKDHKVETSAWIRSLIHTNLPKLKRRVGA